MTASAPPAPYLHFPGTARDALTFYARVFGGSAELHVWPGGFHGFTLMVPEAALSRAAVAAQRDWLRRLLD